MGHSVDNIIVPMAGLGVRFKKNNFSTIKPLIKVDHQCILEKSISGTSGKTSIEILQLKSFPSS